MGLKMDDLQTSLIVVGITVVVVAGIFLYSNRSKEQKSQALRELAQQHGWEYSPISRRLAWGAVITNKTWELRAESRSIGQESDSGSSNIKQFTVFKANWVALQEANLWIGPRLSKGSTFFGLFMPAPVAKLHELDSGMADLSSKYVILGDSQTILDALRISTIPHILVEWPEKIRPVISVTPKSLEISINGYRMEKPEEIEKLVLLGETILSVIEP
jgi:hypothetical protein